MLIHGKWQIQAPENSHNIKIDLTVQVSQKLLYLFPSEWRTAVTPAFTSWQNKHLGSSAFKSPGDMRTGDIFFAWLQHESFSCRKTPECYPINKWHRMWKGPGTHLKSEPSLKTIFLNSEARPDIFTLTSVFSGFPLAFEYPSVFFLSVISAAKLSACSLRSASHIYVAHEHLEQPGCVKGLWSLCRIGRDSIQSDTVADRWCKSLIPFLASRYLSACFPFFSLTMRLKKSHLSYLF